MTAKGESTAFGMPPSEDIALIAELHALPSAGLAPALDVTPQKKKEKTFEALLRQVETLSRQQPVLMLFEDIHWIDPSSRELLDRTMQRIANWPLLLVATFRPEFQPPWIGQPHVTTLALTRLDQRDTAAMVENIAGNHALPDDIVQEIAERTDGVPLFIEELTQAVLESGAHGVAALSSAPHPALSVPATLHASLMARLDRLGPAAKEVAQTGAAIGREFGYELLASIADLPEPQLREALDRLTNSSLLFASGTPPQSTYLFKHALVQDAAYGTLLRGRRQDLHARIGTALEMRFPEVANIHPELLAHHFAEARLGERAIEYTLKAGQQAVKRSAMAEAVALLRKGLALLSSLPESVWRQERELDLQISLGQSLFHTQGGASAVGDAYARARQLCDQLDRPQQGLLVLYGQWLHYLMQAELDNAQQLAAELLQVGEVRGDIAARVMGRQATGYASLYRGDFIRARARLEHALALYDPNHRPFYIELAAQDPLVFILLQLAPVLACLGYVDQALSRSEAGRSPEVQGTFHPYRRVYALWWSWIAGWLARSEPAILLQYVDELSALAAGQGFAFYRGLALIGRGWCLAALGDTAQGTSMVASGLADYHATGSSLGTPFLLTVLADAYRMNAQPQLGLERVAEALRLAETTHEEFTKAETLRLRGELLIQTGDKVGAEASYRDSIALAREQGAKLFELRAATSLARLWCEQGKSKDAQELLAPIYDWFTEGGNAPDLKEAKVLLGEMT